MLPTYELIASQTLGSSAASVTFSGIPQTYDDLVLVYSCRSARSNVSDGISVRLNGAVSDTNHSSRYLQGSGSAASSGSASVAWVGNTAAATATSNTFGSGEIYFPNYTGSTNKSFSATGLGETNGTTAYIHAAACLWSDTSAITGIEMFAQNGSLVANSSFYLFGIREETA